MEKDFLHKGFDGEQHPRLFLSGLISEGSKSYLAKRITLLANEFDQLSRQDSVLPLDKLHSVCALIAMREWEFSAFTPYVKKPKG